MKPEDEARVHIDKMLNAAGWDVQDYKGRNLGASLGVAVRYFPLGKDEADYLLFVNRKAVGVVEAKPEGTTLTGVDTQSDKYLNGIPDNLKHPPKRIKRCSAKRVRGFKFRPRQIFFGGGDRI